MANKVNLTLRIEPELRDQASELFQALGLDLSTATGLFYRQALRCNGLPFEVKLDGPVQPAEEAQAVPPGEEKSPAARTKAKKMAAGIAAALSAHGPIEEKRVGRAGVLAAVEDVALRKPALGGYFLYELLVVVLPTELFSYQLGDAPAAGAELTAYSYNSNTHP